MLTVYKLRYDMTAQIHLYLHKLIIYSLDIYTDNNIVTYVRRRKDTVRINTGFKKI